MFASLYIRLALMAAILAAVAGGYAYITHLQDRAEVAEANVAVADHAARANAAAADAIRKDAERQIAAMAEQSAEAVQRARTYSTLREAVRHAPPPALACPVDPAVLAAVGGLWTDRKADPGDQVGTVDGSGRVAVVPAGSGATSR